MNFKDALKLVGPVQPTFDPETGVWFFESPHFPHLEVHGDTAKTVQEQYPAFLKRHLKDLETNGVTGFIAEATPAWGGKRPGAGRPKGSKGEPKRRVYLPASVANWLQEAKNMAQVRKLMG